MNPPLLAPRGKPVKIPPWLSERTDREKILNTSYLLSPGKTNQNNYFTNITRSRVNEFVNRCGEFFNILITGDRNNKDDFYAIPYAVLKPCLDDEYITHSNGRRAAWVVTIRNHQLKVTKGGPSLDVRDYFGNQADLTSFSKSPNTPCASDLADRGSDVPDRVETTIYRILRDTELARSIKALHKDQCQICAETIDLPDGRRYSEAHHLKPLGKPDNGPDVAGNIIVLCPKHHVMCDLGVMKLNRSALRTVKEHRIDDAYLVYHNDVICNG